MYEKLYIYIDLFINKLRILHLRLRGAKVGKGVKSFGAFKIMNAKNLTLGDFCTINENVFINCRDVVVIGSNCHLSPNVQIHTGKLNLIDFPRKHTSDKIVIEDNVWLATGSLISAGVTVSKNSVIGANSVVIKNVDSDCFYGGNPAKKIKNIYV
jgi:putative colanic acid biosynthesis acetyltransferase WcaF